MEDDMNNYNSGMEIDSLNSANSLNSGYDSKNVLSSNSSMGYKSAKGDEYGDNWNDASTATQESK
jgi:hypothetical protein